MSTVSGKVTDANGTVSGATVLAVNTEKSSVTATATSYDEGKFVIALPVSGTYSLTASKTGESNLNVDVDSGNTHKDSLSLGIGFTAVQVSD